MAREETIRKVLDTVLWTGNASEDNKRILTNALIKALEQEPRWIPVSERLPENQDYVLVWIEYIKDDFDCACWEFAYYSLRFKKWVVSTNERNPIVKAWMPLPEPYEPTESEKGDNR